MRLSTIEETKRAEKLSKLPAHWVNHFSRDFPSLAHKHQLAPERANSGADWTTWLILGGRGAGKTRAGAEWVRELALGDPHARIALIGETEHDAREVMVEGISGLFAVHRYDERPQWIPSRRRVEWKNGAVAQVFSAEDPESLRGPQFSAAWADELAKWRQTAPTRSPQTWRNGR
jgi:phage terminase large subunit-like protein